MDMPLGINAFAPACEVEVDPEFPPGGEWSCPVFAFDRDGRVVEEFVSRWSAPRTLPVVHPR